VSGIPQDPPERHRAIAGRFTELTLGAQEWDAGNRIDQAPPNNQADQPNPQPSDPVRVGIGMTMAEVESAMGRPATILAPPGNRIIYLYSNVKVTFIDGKVSDIQ